MPARPPRALWRRALLAVGAAALAGACGSSEAASPPPASGTVGGVGALPEALTTDPAVSSASSTADVPAPTATSRVVEAGVVADDVDGNRVILIGDSLLASTSRRYGGQMCDALVPLGWVVEVDAETGRFIDFGDRVLDARLRPERGVDWDVAVVFLGNNYNGDEDTYRDGLEDIVRRLSPRPVVLLTVTEFRADRVEVNDVVRSIAARQPDVRVVDWNAITAADDSLVGDDGLHLTEAGRGRLAFEIAAVLGGAPVGEDPECLSTSFSDDSAGDPSGGTTRPTGGRSTGSRSTTTVPRTGGAGAAVTTTVAAPRSTTVPAPTAPSPPTTTPAAPPPTTQAPLPPTTAAVVTPPPSGAVVPGGTGGG